MTKFNIFSNKKKPEVVHNKKKIIIYQSELDYLSKCILESPAIETGGNLFGLSTPFGIPMILYTVGPGPEAIHHVTHFRQDFNFLEKNADCLVEEHALHHIGSWHSHHSLGLTQPSAGDSVSTLEGMRECRLNNFLLIIGNCKNGKSSVRPYRYHIDGECEMLKWVVLPGESPIRKAYDHAHTDIIYVPSGTAMMERLDTCSLIDNHSGNQSPVTYPAGYWLNDSENKREFAEMVQFLKSRFDNVRIYQKEDKTIEIQIVNGTCILRLHLNMYFPANAPALYTAKGTNVKLNTGHSWSVKDDHITESFIKFIESIEYDTRKT